MSKENGKNPEREDPPVIIIKSEEGNSGSNGKIQK